MKRLLMKQFYTKAANVSDSVRAASFLWFTVKSGANISNTSALFIISAPTFPQNVRSIAVREVTFSPDGACLPRRGGGFTVNT